MRKNKKFLLVSLSLFACLFILTGCSQVSLTGTNSSATPALGEPNGTHPAGVPDQSAPRN